MVSVTLQDVLYSLMRETLIGHIKDITIRVVQPDPTSDAGTMLIVTAADGKPYEFLLKKQSDGIETVAALNDVIPYSAPN